MDNLVSAVQQFGFPIVISVGLGYFVYYVWRTIINVINPAIKNMHMGLIKLIDQIRMLDNDMIRLQEEFVLINPNEVNKCGCGVSATF